MTVSAMAARNSYLTEVQATTEKARVLKCVVRFAKFLHYVTTRLTLTCGNFLACHTACKTNGLAAAVRNVYLTEV